MESNSSSNLNDYLYGGLMMKRTELRTEAEKYALVKEARAYQERTQPKYGLRSKLGLKIMNFGLVLVGRLETSTARELFKQIQNHSHEQLQDIYVRQN